MIFLERLRAFEQRYPLALVSLLIAVFFGWPAYYGFSIDTKPQIRYEILSDSTVFEVKESIEDLAIFYRGENIQEQGNSLRIYRLRVINDSDADVRIADYDPNAPLGLSAVGSEIVSAEIIESSNDYLRKNLSLIEKSNSERLFSKVILDGHQYFDINLLVLHSIGVVPEIYSIGHVAGVKNIPVSKDGNNKSRIAGVVIQLIYLLIIFVVVVPFLESPNRGSVNPSPLGDGYRMYGKDIQ